MNLFTFNVHVQNPDGKQILHELKHLKNTIMPLLDDIKAKLAIQDIAIDGLQADLDFIKAKLANAEGGLTAAEVTELVTLIDARTEKLQAMDAQTDSTTPKP